MVTTPCTASEALALDALAPGTPGDPADGFVVEPHLQPVCH
jgi:hypothetical protein